MRFLGVIIAVFLSGSTATTLSAAPAIDCAITAFGAHADDGLDDTGALQTALDRCTSVGRRVLVPAGRFDIGHIRLPSGTDLYLAPNARLVASLDLADYPRIPEIKGNRAWIYADRAKNISIAGLGTFDGQAQPVYQMMEEIIARDRNDRRADDRVRYGLLFRQCSNVRIRDIHIVDTQMYLMHINDCDDVAIDGITMRAPVNSHNTDGLQISDSRDVRVTNCNISVGDDGIVTKAQHKPIERLLVDNCVISSDDGAIKFGTRSESAVRDSQFSNIIITDSRYGIALYMIHGGEYTNNRFSNIQIVTGGRHPRTYPIFVDVDDRMPAGSGHRLGVIDGLVFSDIDIRSNGNVLIGGHPKSPIRNLVLNDVRVLTKSGEPKRPQDVKPMGNRRFDPVPGSPDLAPVDATIVIGHADGVTLENVSVRGTARRPDFHLKAVVGLSVGAAEIVTKP